MRVTAAVVLTLLAAVPLAAQTAADSAGVREAALDYVNAIYHADTSLVYRSVRPELAKRGYWIPRNGTGYSNEPMTFAELVEVARSWNAKGRDMSASPKEVRILDILNQTASARLVAAWGVDYMHLAKYDGKWMIVNILWQSPPPTPR
jgi:hypothetical protein